MTLRNGPKRRKRKSASHGSSSSKKILVYTFLGSILWSVFLGSKIIPAIDTTVATTMMTSKSFMSMIPTVANSDKSRMVDCYLQLEAKKQIWIDQWLDLDAPLLDSVIRNVSVASPDVSPTTYSYQYSLVFVMKHVDAKEWARADWYCNDETQVAFKRIASEFVHLIQCKFNSTIPPNEEEKRPMLQSLWPNKLVGFRAANESSSASMNNQFTGVQLRYDDSLTSFLECDRKERKYNKEIFGSDPQDDNDSPFIGSCVIVRETFQYLPAWVEFHRLMGIEHFWVFVNQPWEMEIPATVQSSSDRYERPYITYMPYNFFWGDHYNHSKHHKPARAIFWQEPMQMKCLYNAKRLGLDWVTTTDVDEYIFVNDSSYHFEGAGSNEWDNPNLPRRKFPLRDFLRDHEEEFAPLAAVAMNSVFFGRNVQTEGVPPEDMMLLHYIHRSTDPIWSRWKQIYRVKNANVAGVHEVLAAKRKESTQLEQVYFQHYKNPHKGVFWADKNNITRDSRMRDLYLEKVVAAMSAPIAAHNGG